MPTSFAPSHLPASLLPVARFDDAVVGLNVRGQVEDQVCEEGQATRSRYVPSGMKYQT